MVWASQLDDAFSGDVRGPQRLDMASLSQEPDVFFRVPPQVEAGDGGDVALDAALVVQQGERRGDPFGGVNRHQPPFGFETGSGVARFRRGPLHAGPDGRLNVRLPVVFKHAVLIQGSWGSRVPAASCRVFRFGVVLLYFRSRIRLTR